MTRTSTRVTLRPDERDELHALARAAGIPLAEAMRRGARLVLGAPGEPGEYRRGRPRKETANSAT